MSEGDVVGYAKAPIVYRVSRNTIGPVLRPLGFRRIPRTSAAWSRETQDVEISVGIRVSVFGDALSTGNELEASVTRVDVVQQTQRIGPLVRLLAPEARRDLWRAQSAINRERPVSTVVVDWLSGAHPVPAEIRAHYVTPPAELYMNGDVARHSYYSVHDVERLVSVLALGLPAALAMLEESPEALGEPTQMFGTRVRRTWRS